MNLTIREAATLIGRSERTLRGQLARGEIAGVKRDGRWLLPRDALPMTESQRRALQARADAVRSAVDSALPSRTAARAGERRRSIVDVDCFRAAKDVWHALCAAANDSRSSSELGAARDSIQQGVLELCHGVVAFDPPSKISALRAARASFSRALGHLFLTHPVVPAEPARTCAVRLEAEVLPALGGLLRWAERLPERKR